MDNRFRHFGLSVNASENWSEVQSDCTDTTLRLNSPGTASLSCNMTSTKRKCADINKNVGFAHASLALSLGHTPSSLDSSKRSLATSCSFLLSKEMADESSMNPGLSFPSSKKPAAAILKDSETKSLFDLNLSLSTGPSESIVTNVTLVSAQPLINLNTPSLRPLVDDGSTSACWKFGAHLLPYLQASELNNKSSSGLKIHAIVDPVTPMPVLSSTIKPAMESLAACTSGISPLNTSTKNCQFQGCVKGARGASGHCIAHGGGRRCQKEGCQKGAEGRTIYCKAHGGGRRCEHLGCTKSAEGRTDSCIAHGGGRRCSREGCIRAARGKSGLCIRHGGGKRCQKENCVKSAEGHSGLCISHGGGRRCHYPECTKGAQGGTLFCKAHGGGKRCTFSGCTKGAEGITPFCKGHGGGKRCSFQGGGVCPKSVHGGTQFCVAHGGGKRCAEPACTKSARGRTNFCVRHGGGKRCKFEGCGKSAQGRTDFCKAHGGGNRCAWGQPGSELGAGGPACDHFARGKSGLCASHSALVQDNRVHGGELMDSMTARNATPNKSKKMKEVAVEEDIFKRTGGGGQGLIFWSSIEKNNFVQPTILCQSKMLSLPEGRVHGGSLMAMLASDAALMSRSESQCQVEGSTSKQQGAAYPMAYNWI